MMTAFPDNVTEANLKTGSCKTGRPWGSMTPCKSHGNPVLLVEYEKSAVPFADIGQDRGITYRYRAGPG